jgi:excisionase family DNA binding protein
MRITLDDIDEMLSVSDAATKLRVSEDTIYRMIAKKDIDFVRIGSGRGRIMIPPAALVDYVNRHHVPSVANERKRSRAS